MKKPIRGRWAYRNGKMVRIDAPQAVSRSHSIITDTIDPIRHPCNGKLYDSKSAFRDTTKAYNCVEIGNEKPKGFQEVRQESTQDRMQVREELIKAMYGR